MQSICVAFKAHMGWVNTVAVRVNTDMPLPLNAQRVDLLGATSRDVVEPYHVAGGWSGLERVPRPSNPALVIRRGRRKQVAATRAQLDVFREMLKRQDLQWTRAVMLTARGRLGEDLEHILGSHAHIHVAEGEAIRDATRAALEAMNIDQIDQDEKSILPEASRHLACADCDTFMKDRRPSGAKSWRKEERMIALGAWLNRT